MVVQVPPLPLCPVSLGNTFDQDLSGRQGDSEATADPSAPWPTVEPTAPVRPGPQQPFLLQPGSYPAGGDWGQAGVPVPLYSVPETHLPGIGGGLAVTEAPGGRAWEEAQQTQPHPGEACAGLAGWAEQGWREGAEAEAREELGKACMGVCP